MSNTLFFTRCQLTVLLGLLPLISAAATPVFEIDLQHHLFQPDTLTIPANVKIKLIIHNRDSTPEEFESYQLNREKVIVGGGKGIIFLGPLPPGEYKFFGDFNPQTALGTIIVEDTDDVDE